MILLQVLLYSHSCYAHNSETDEVLYCTTSILARCEMGLTSRSRSLQPVCMCVCMHVHERARASRSSTTGVRRGKRRKPGGQSTWRLGSRRPCLLPRRPARLYREGTTESRRIIYTSLAEKERKRESSFATDRLWSEKERNGRSGWGSKGQGGRRETRSNLERGVESSWKWMQLIRQRCFPAQPLHEERRLSMRTARSSRLVWSRQSRDSRSTTFRKVGWKRLFVEN